MLSELTWQAYVAVGVILSLLLLLSLTQLPADVVFLGGLAVLMVTGVLDIESALQGFSAPGLMTVGVLYVVATGLQETGGLSWVSRNVLGMPKTIVGAYLRMLPPVVGLSAFMNNTPVVAMFIPVVTEWCKRIRLPVSKMMIPLSYVALLGGVCTLIGTSTNLVVNTLVQKHFQGVPLGKGLEMFEITKIGLPCMVVGCLYLLMVGHRLLPDRKTAHDIFDCLREYTLELEVAAGSSLVGRTIEKAGLRHLEGGFLVELIRQGQVFAAVSPDEILQQGDRLVFVGSISTMRDLRQYDGLLPAPDQLFKLDAPRHQRCLVEVVVSNLCPLVGKTIREGKFRSVYNAVVIAVARNGERITGKLGEIKLRTGDMLLVESHAGFIPRQKESRDFFVVSEVENATVYQHAKAPLALGILLALVVGATAGINMLIMACLAAGAMLVFKCCSIAQARKSIEWNVLVVIGAALALGTALEKTGTARVLTGTLLNAIHHNPWLALAVVYTVTVMITELITNNAAAVLVFPFAMNAADRLGVNPMPFVICIMIGASASFLTPIGYQTNLMVYGPGGYRVRDYVKVGFPLSLLVGIVTVGLSPIIWPFK
jgi:di/tricarboxylate transporter